MFALAFALYSLELRSAAPAIPTDIQARIRQRVDYGYHPGMIVGLQNRDGAAYFAYGQTDWIEGQPVGEHTLFEIGSITKVFTTTALADMARHEQLSLSNQVQSFLPPGIRAPVFQGTAITLLHLATHSSGLPGTPLNLPFEDGSNPFAGYTVEQMFEFLGSYSLTRRPGTLYEYSNYGVGLLGHLLASVAGTSYESLLRDRVTSVLGLADTLIQPGPDQRIRLARGFSGVVPVPDFDMAALEGAGALRSTASDLMVFLAANRGWLPSPLYPAMTNAHRLHFTTASSGLSLGLGWHRLQLPRGTAIYHDGATIGHRAFIGFLQGGETVALALANGDYDLSDVAFRLLDSNVPLTAVRRPSEVAPEVLRHYVGRYQRSDTDHFTVDLLDHRLAVAYSGDRGRRFTLYPSSAARFYLHFPEAQATFTTNTAGHTISLLWNQSGSTTTYPKVPQPSHLVARRTPTGLALDLLGDSDRDYVIEATTDFRNWTAVSTNTIWDSPIEMPWSGASDHRFFRAREP